MRRRSQSVVRLIGAIGLVLAASPAAAQETREQEIADAQAKKAAEVRKYEPSKAERWAVAFPRERSVRPQPAAD